MVPFRVKQESLVYKTAKGEGLVNTGISCWFIFATGDIFYTWLYLSTKGSQVHKHGHSHKKILGYLLDTLRYLKIKTMHGIYAHISFEKPIYLPFYTIRCLSKF